MDCIIVDHDNLRALGLQSLLAEEHGLEAAVVENPAMVEGIGEQTLFFVTPEAFASMPMFYVPRRDCVALIGNLATAPLPVINPCAPSAEIAAQIAAVVQRHGAAKPPATLTPREADVLRLIAMGCINKEIADRLGITLNTVLSHRKNIAAKLGRRSVASLSLYAMMNGLIPLQADKQV